MVSKTRMIELVRGHQAQAVERALAESPALAAYRDERGRNWLHLCCMARPTRGSGASLRVDHVSIEQDDAVWQYLRDAQADIPLDEEPLAV